MGIHRGDLLGALDEARADRRAARFRFFMLVICVSALAAVVNTRRMKSSSLRSVNRHLLGAMRRLLPRAG